MVAVQATPIAEQQIARLRGRPKSSFDTWLARLKTSGCAALTYRLSGADIERLCVFHLYGELRVIVAFATPDHAVVLLVGPHDDADPDVDVYTQLYDLMAIPIPDGPRDKPSCCGTDGPPLWGEEAELLADLFRRVARRR
jgi:hypothetical protein